MRPLIILTLLAATAAWVVVRQLPEGQAEGRSYSGLGTRAQEVQSITFDGQHLPTALLHSLLVTHVGALLDGPTLDKDRAALEHALTERGYRSAHVESAQVSFDASGGAYVSFAVVQGPLFHLRTITVKGGNDALVTLATGDTAEADRLERARQMLADTLTYRGKPAHVGIELSEDAAAASVDVVLTAR